MSSKILNRKVGEKPKARSRRRRTGTIESEQEAVKDAKLTTDVIILVMGKAGVGKSTFINTLLGREVMQVGHELQACTNGLQSTTLDRDSIDRICPQFEGRQVLVLETPGFDTYQDDSLIIHQVNKWLNDSYPNGIKLGGIIFLQDITERRVVETGARELRFAKALCGSKAFNKIIFVTTNWEAVTEATENAREEALKAKPWKEMIAKGSTVMRFDLTRDSASAIMRKILILNDPVVGLFLKIQEMINSNSSGQTVTVRELRHSIEQVLEIYKQMHPEDENEELWRRVKALEAQMKPLVRLRSMSNRTM